MKLSRERHPPFPVNRADRYCSRAIKSVLATCQDEISALIDSHCVDMRGADAKSGILIASCHNVVASVGAGQVMVRIARLIICFPERIVSGARLGPKVHLSGRLVDKRSILLSRLAPIPLAAPLSLTPRNTNLRVGW